MNKQETVSAVLQVLSYTQAMQQKSEHDLWNDFVEIEQQRQDVIATIFPIDDNNVTEQIKTSIQKIIDLNQIIETQCREAKQEAKIQMQGLNQNKKAITAYGSR